MNAIQTTAQQAAGQQQMTGLDAKKRHGDVGLDGGAAHAAGGAVNAAGNIDAHDLLLAGATQMKNKKKWADIIKSVVAGKIVNCFSTSDEILSKLFTLSVGYAATGSGINELTDNLDISRKQTKNTKKSRYRRCLYGWRVNPWRSFVLRCS